MASYGLAFGSPAWTASVEVTVFRWLMAAHTSGAMKGSAASAMARRDFMKW
jgi:hypothetical protein